MCVISNNYTHSTMHWLRGLPSIKIHTMHCTGYHALAERAPVHHLNNEFTDLQLVLNSAAIIQHAPSGWSSYTSVPAIAYQAESIPLINTYSCLKHKYKANQTMISYYNIIGVKVYVILWYQL
jgi:hypothetical protein